MIQVFYVGGPLNGLFQIKDDNDPPPREGVRILSMEPMSIGSVREPLSPPRALDYYEHNYVPFDLPPSRGQGHLTSVALICQS